MNKRAANVAKQQSTFWKTERNALKDTITTSTIITITTTITILLLYFCSSQNGDRKGSGKGSERCQSEDLFLVHLHL
jgi:hypothetical protein